MSNSDLDRKNKGLKPTIGSLDHGKLVGGFRYFVFSSLPGEMIQFDSYFSDGLKPPTKKSDMLHLFTYEVSIEERKEKH